MYRKKRTIRTLCFVLSFCILLYGCESTTGLSASQAQTVNQQNNEVTDIVVGTVAFTVLITTIVIIAANGQAKKQKAQQQAEGAKFQACVGKTKAEVYTIYGPPNSIVDDGQNDGGTILEYLKVVSSGGDQSNVSTVTYRKLFYLNKDNIVVSVKEDQQ